MFYVALADSYGDVFMEKGIVGRGRSGVDIVPLKDEDMIPLPACSSIMMLPDRHAVGGAGGKEVVIKEIEGEKVFPAACIPPPGYTRTLLPAYKREKRAGVLPFFSYTALAWKDESLYCAAVRTHKDLRWDPAMYNSLDLKKKIKLKKKKHPKNRLLAHLEKCSLEYHCFTAQNIFYERWEGGIPTAAACNAACGGCISENRILGVPSPQDRINFVPTADEIAEIAIPHLNMEGGIVSFGQGCEGEPLTRVELIEEAIKKIRSVTSLGTININTNGSMPGALEKLFNAGLDSVRISLNSAIEERYSSYFQPKNYSFKDVLHSIDLALSKGVFTSLNFLYLPGVNDREEEADAFFKLLKSYPVDMIQFRNLNIDPDYYFKIMKNPKGGAMGTVKFIKTINDKFPKIKTGNFSIPVR